MKFSSLKHHNNNHNNNISIDNFETMLIGKHKHKDRSKTDVKCKKK